MTRPRKKSLRKRDSNPGSSALEADVLPLGQRGGPLNSSSLHPPACHRKFISTILAWLSLKPVLFLLLERRSSSRLRRLRLSWETICNCPHAKLISCPSAPEVCLFVCWLFNVPATCECISGTDLLNQFYVLPH